MDVIYSMTSVNTGGIKENNRLDLVINYCKTVDTDFSIFQETHVNFSHLHDIRDLLDEEVIISPGKTGGPSRLNFRTPIVSYFY